MGGGPNVNPNFCGVFFWYFVRVPRGCRFNLDLPRPPSDSQHRFRDGPIDHLPAFPCLPCIPLQRSTRASLRLTCFFFFLFCPWWMDEATGREEGNGMEKGDVGKKRRKKKSRDRNLSSFLMGSALFPVGTRRNGRGRRDGEMHHADNADLGSSFSRAGMAWLA